MGSLNKKSSITFLGLSIDVVYLLKIIVKENVEFLFIFLKNLSFFFVEFFFITFLTNFN